MKKRIASLRAKPDRRQRLAVIHVATGQERETRRIYTRSECLRLALATARESPFLKCRIQSV